MDRRDFLERAFYAGAGILGIGALTAAVEYLDVPGPIKAEWGRTKNSIAAVVAGLVGKKLYENSTINIEIQKHIWPNAKVIGQTTPTSIDTYVDLATTSAHFVANENEDGQLVGEVDKSEFDWKVKQTSTNSYDFARWGPKFDANLILNVADGKISGTYVRTGPNFNWDVIGTYDDNGNVNIEIDGPVNLGIRLVGRIDKQ
jgi:hypothetical protein